MIMRRKEMSNRYTCTSVQIEKKDKHFSFIFSITLIYSLGNGCFLNKGYYVPAM